ncbi:lipocalin-like domain-containing protein [Flavobacterium luteum]|uniref:Lipocalin-like domain-containing protein n=1 Tax=Flavobacterium luteum TaxID=2026654 RepID=A0A7J5AKT4_9FLAO|nr:lipocalin-like domain-containing protein [Flavobacterium luteum]KAB1158100.1 lipocalin-like domain-containing protein [Flavobacterium luteum]
MSSPTLTSPTKNLATAIRGVWWLLSREDWTNDNIKKIDPTLGAEPIGILTYALTHFAAQFMKRDRSDDVAPQVYHSGKNNTSATAGYDAYFGTYEVNEQTGQVAHVLIGSITPSNIGMTVLRNLRIKKNKLIIQLETTSTEGEPIIRTLVWKRIS